MIERTREVQTILKLLQQHSVVGVIGARQVGKTTLARNLSAEFRGPSFYYDLENPEDLSKLSDPMLALKPLEGLVVIDEIQQQPDLYRILRVLVDRPNHQHGFYC